MPKKFGIFFIAVTVSASFFKIAIADQARPATDSPRPPLIEEKSELEPNPSYFINTLELNSYPARTTGYPTYQNIDEHSEAKGFSYRSYSPNEPHALAYSMNLDSSGEYFQASALADTYPYESLYKPLWRIRLSDRSPSENFACYQIDYERQPTHLSAMLYAHLLCRQSQALILRTIDLGDQSQRVVLLGNLTDAYIEDARIGGFLAISSRDALLLVNTATGTVAHRFALPGAGFSREDHLTFLKAGDRYFYAGSAMSALYVFDGRTDLPPQAVPLDPLPPNTYNVVPKQIFLTDRDLIAVTPGTIYRFDPATLALLWKSSLPKADQSAFHTSLVYPRWAKLLLAGDYLYQPAQDCTYSEFPTGGFAGERCDYFLRALDRRSGQLLWESQRTPGVRCTSVQAGLGGSAASPRVVLGSDCGASGEYDAVTGKTLQ